MPSNLLLLLSPNFHRLNASVQEDVYRQCFQFLSGPVMYLVHDHAAAEDIIQETFMKTLEKLPQADSEQALRGWMRTVAKNLTYDYLRKTKKAANDLSFENVMYDAGPYIATAKESVEAEAELNILEETISSQLRTMKPDYRIIMELKWRKGLSYKEIAAEVDETEDTVRNKLHAVREKLKKTLRKGWRDAN